MAANSCNPIVHASVRSTCFPFSSNQGWMRGLLRAIYAAGSIGLMTAGTLQAAGQNAYFSGSTTQIASTYSFLNPQGVTVDANGDLFVADAGNNAIEEIVLLAGVYQTPTVLPAPSGGYNQPHRRCGRCEW